MEKGLERESREPFSERNKETLDNQMKCLTLSLGGRGYLSYFLHASSRLWFGLTVGKDSTRHHSERNLYYYHKYYELT